MTIKEQFIKRGKSLLWRIGMMTLAFSLAFASENLASLPVSPEVTVVIGLILGEVSKYVNNALHELA